MVPTTDDLEIENAHLAPQPIAFIMFPSANENVNRTVVIFSTKARLPLLEVPAYAKRLRCCCRHARHRYDGSIWGYGKVFFPETK
jgi:hypothetical protein